MEDKCSALVEIEDLDIESMAYKSNFNVQIGKLKASRGGYLLRGYGREGEEI